MSREKKLVKNTLILSIGSILPKITQIIILPIYTSSLTKAEFGTYDLINILIVLMIPIITLQLERAAFRFLIDVRGKSDSKKIISNVYIFVFAVSAIVLIILSFTYPSLDVNIRILVLFFLFSDVFIAVTRQVARGLGYNKDFSISSVVQALFNMIFAVVFLMVLDWGLEGLLLSLTISTILPLAYLICKCRILSQVDIKSFDKTFLSNMLKYSVPMIPNSISIWIVNVSDRIIITSILGIESTAVYAIANKFPNLIRLVYGNFNMAWQESASIASEDVDVNEYYSNIFDHLYKFIIGVTSVLIAFTPIMFAVLIRGSYDEAYFQISILFFGILFSTMSSFYGGIYVAFKQTKKIGIASLAVALLNIVLNLIFIREIGIYAASISTFVSYFILVMYRIYDVNKFIKIQYNWGKMVSYLLVLIVMGILNYQRNFTLDAVNLVFGIVFAVVINREVAKRIIKRIMRKVG